MKEVKLGERYQYKPYKQGNYILLTKRMKQSARKLAHKAVKDGRITKLPCEFADCTQVKVEAHHPDYSMPLEVLWLCRAHHLELHKYLPTVYPQAHFAVA